MSTHHHQIRWRNLETEGLELVRVDITPSLIDVTGRVISTADKRDFALDYALELDVDWQLLRADLRLIDGHSLSLRRSDAGHWLNGHEVKMPALDGAVDIDIFATPFTNSLPINRLKLAEGDKAQTEVIYIADLELTPTMVQQNYACTGPQHYDYESLTTGFKTAFDVDENGYVRDYPDLFERL
ncbi:putative glycolipid-binding domain-containing protein [Maritalea mediterranea]|uniref:Glycolipid-binding domain-containing protein n=1 Tax=Maritalea mediterranea TaxID=2909667 RepID=A0ABS9EBM8_9HYPH|nr:putative glycolipid-binding domain-containing protein [Maritalea mediterranea]MCF4099592.1 putative glycolipid-binding domain-containing protein [Maritalea mediterranea]